MCFLASSTHAYPQSPWSLVLTSRCVSTQCHTHQPRFCSPVPTHLFGFPPDRPSPSPGANTLHQRTIFRIHLWLSFHLGPIRGSTTILEIISFQFLTWEWDNGCILVRIFQRYNGEVDMPTWFSSTFIHYLSSEIEISINTSFRILRKQKSPTSPSFSIWYLFLFMWVLINCIW